MTNAAATARRAAAPKGFPSDEGMVSLWTTLEEVNSAIGARRRPTKDLKAAGAALALVADAVRQPVYVVVDGAPKRVEAREHGHAGLELAARQFAEFKGERRRLWLCGATLAALLDAPEAVEAFALLQVRSDARDEELRAVRAAGFARMRAGRAAARAA